MKAWEDLLDEFRSLGGTADNIRLGDGEFGRGLFPIDQARPVVIDIPDNLLVATKDMISVKGVPRVGPAANIGERERAWLNRYQEDVAWGDGEAGGIRKMFDMAAELPADLRHELASARQFGDWFQEPTESLILQCYLESRHVGHKGKRVVMPLIDLINHGDGARYEGTDSVSFTGTFPGEIFANYSICDPLTYFQSWGIVTASPLAFSVVLSIKHSAISLVVHRDYLSEREWVPERGWVPEIEQGPDKLALQFVMIGNEHFPRRCKGIFYQLMRSAGYSGFEELFDHIQRANWLHFLNLLRTIQGIDLPMARMLQAVAYCQLRAMSSCFGVREI